MSVYTLTIGCNSDRGRTQSKTTHAVGVIRFGRRTISRVGILAYGSLIEEPGMEIEPLICERKERIETPFSIEFARSSSSRCGAPTVVLVESGGCRVHATILVLDSAVSLEKAQGWPISQSKARELKPGRLKRMVSATLFR